jgi:hypothetical protein
LNCHKDKNLRKETWDSSTKITKTLTLDDFGVTSAVSEAAKPKRSAKNRRAAVIIHREMAEKGVLINKTGVKARISGKAVGKIISTQALNMSFSS